MKQTYALLIWNEIPEYVKIILIPNQIVTSEFEFILNQAQGSFIGSTFQTSKQEEACLQVMNSLLDKDWCKSEDTDGLKIDPKWNGILVPYIVDDGVLRENPIPAITGKIITRVFTCGLFL